MLKRLYHRYVIPFLANDLVLAWYRRLRRPRPSILLYHGVSDDDQEQRSGQVIGTDSFAAQLAYLRENYVNLTLAQLVEAGATGAALPRNGIAITFDDGYENNYRYALPLLLRYGFTAAIFVNPKYVELSQQKAKIVLWWDVIAYLLDAATLPDFMAVFAASGIILPRTGDLNELKIGMEEALKDAPVETMEAVVRQFRQRFAGPIEAARFPGLMNWDQVKACAASGIEIGAHTMSHVAAAALPVGRYEEELLRPKLVIEEKLGKPVEFFAFPYGQRRHYSGRALAYLKDSGYRCLLLVLGGKDDREKDPLCYNRIPIVKDESLAVFKLKAAGLYEDLQGLIKAGRSILGRRK